MKINLACLVIFCGFTTALAQDKPLPVNVGNFARAESDLYFRKVAEDGAFGKLVHRREPADIEKQDIVRMNRDTLYSNGVFDLDAAPIKVTLPDPGQRFMSMQVLSQDQYTTEVVYAPGTFTYSKNQVGTRYVFLIIRTLADPRNPADLKAVHALQDSIQITQASTGKFEVPLWDRLSQDKAREALSVLGSLGGTKVMFGRKDEVDPVSFLIGSAIGWGGNPPSAAIYNSVFPKASDGKTVHRLTVKDVPVDGFWSISVYNKTGYFEKNELGLYSLNNLTARRSQDGSFTIQFGGNPKDAPNYLPITPGWNYIVRMYRPRKEVLDGTWKFPEAEPIQ
jgi:hypothetical protein